MVKLLSKGNRFLKNSLLLQFTTFRRSEFAIYITYNEIV